MPIPIDGQNHTDETECEQWECNNIYTHDNNEWNCPTIEDELNCLSKLSTLFKSTFMCFTSYKSIDMPTYDESK